MTVSDESGHAGRTAHGSPRLICEIHANEYVSGELCTAHQFALPGLDLDDLFHRNFDLEDVVLHVERDGTCFEV